MRTPQSLLPNVSPIVCDITGLQKAGLQKIGGNDFSHFGQNMFWILKRTVSMRRFFRAPKTHIDNNHIFTQQSLA